ncbi:MAG: PDZ domain-containing protein [candidate division WOR-3 bacterium]
MLRLRSIIVITPLLLISIAWAFQQDTAPGWLGVVIEELSPAMRVVLGIDHGVLVSQVIEDSPADRAGLRMGDVILALDRIPIDNTLQLQELIRPRAGEQVAITCLRRQRKMTLPVHLGTRVCRPQPPELLPRELQRALRGIWHRLWTDRDLYQETLDSLRLQLEELMRQLQKLQRQLDERR